MSEDIVSLIPFSILIVIIVASLSGTYIHYIDRRIDLDLKRSALSVAEHIVYSDSEEGILQAGNIDSILQGLQMPYETYVEVFEFRSGRVWKTGNVPEANKTFVITLPILIHESGLTLPAEVKVYVVR